MPSEAAEEKLNFDKELDELSALIAEVAKLSTNKPATLHAGSARTPRRVVSQKTPDGEKEIQSTEQNDLPDRETGSRAVQTERSEEPVTARRYNKSLSMTPNANHRFQQKHFYPISNGPARINGLHPGIVSDDEISSESGDETRSIVPTHFPNGSRPPSHKKPLKGILASSEKSQANPLGNVKRPGSVIATSERLPLSNKLSRKNLTLKDDMNISYAIEGYLLKYEHKKRDWIKRWFVLHDGTLYIYKKKGGRKSSCIPLRTLIFKHFDEDETVFEINTETKRILVGASSIKEREKWEDELWKQRKEQKEPKFKQFLLRFTKRNINIEGTNNQKISQYNEFDSQQRRKGVRMTVDLQELENEYLQEISPEEKEPSPYSSDEENLQKRLSSVFRGLRDSSLRKGNRKSMTPIAPELEYAETPRTKKNVSPLGIRSSSFSSNF